MKPSAEIIQANWEIFLTNIEEYISDKKDRKQKTTISDFIFIFFWFLLIDLHQLFLQHFFSSHSSKTYMI